jgi:hypothetical protein
MIMIAAALFCAAITLAGLSLAQQSTQSADEETVLISDSGQNLSVMNWTLTSAIELFGQAGFDIAEAVKFTASDGWTLDGVQILGWDGFNGTSESVPSDGAIALEVRDSDLNLLYRFTDSQMPYFNFRNNVTSPIVASIDLPEIPVSGDFYLCFYDRGSVVVGAEVENATGNSYVFNRVNKELVPALPTGPNQTEPVNWVIRAVGH